MLHTQSFRIHTAKLLGGFAILFLGFVTLGFQSKTHPQDEEINRTVSALNSDGDKAIFYHVKIDANGAATVTKSVLTTIAGVQNQLCYVGRAVATEINEQNNLDVWLPKNEGYNYYYLPFAEGYQAPTLITLGSGSDSISGPADASIECHCFKSPKGSKASHSCDAVVEVTAFNLITVGCTEKNDCVQCGKPVIRYNGKISAGDGMTNVLVIRAKSIVLK